MSRPRTAALSVEARLKEFLRDAGIRPAVAETLLQLYDWLNAIKGGGTRPGRSRAKLSSADGGDILKTIAESLVSSTEPLERAIQSKSIQEALFYSVNFEPGSDYQEFQQRFGRAIHRWSENFVLQRFLGLYFFNLVWFHTGDCFRTVGETCREYEKEMRQIERLCQEAVATAWKSFEKSKSTLDPPSSGRLVAAIEAQIWGSEA